MSGYKILVWFFIICLMAENSQQNKKIRGLQADIRELKADVEGLLQDVYDDFESVEQPKGVEILDLDFKTGEVKGTRLVTPEEVMETDD